MEKRKLARIAVSAAVYSCDKPYLYLIPEDLYDKAVPGIRVMVPFGHANKDCEGIILSTEYEQKDKTEGVELKSVEEILDQEPILTQWQIQLALWMRDRFFCTVYDAVHAILPAGIWVKPGKRVAGKNTAKYISLAIPPEEATALAEQKRTRAPLQAEVLSLLSSMGEALCSDVMDFTGASASTISALARQDLIKYEVRSLISQNVVESEHINEHIIFNKEQQVVYDGLKNLLDTGKSSVSLLFGVTGSGKTSIYIELVRHTLEIGRTAIVLVPEISLTPQFISIFSSYFGNDVAVLHSSLTGLQRYEEWKKIKSGEVRVVIGTRSAVFAPLENLGICIIDEEQEHTYKSENSPRYSTRDIAKYRCYHSNSLLILGSATPAVESMYLAQTGKYRLFTLEHRYNTKPLPDVSIINMRDELKKGNEVFSSSLRKEIDRNINNGEQSILFINRRGASSSVVCGECGYTFMCPNCSVAMTYHSHEKKLICHYCGHTQTVPTLCPKCGGKLKFVGIGTQKAEDELKKIFPGIEVIRMDADSVSHFGSHAALLDRFKSENIPILLGTQMITKGLDFDNVTLVGIISADYLLYSGSYRSRERTFSLITQVVGRSGRGSKRGRAVIQTYTPENETIRLASKQDYVNFFNSETALRNITKAPPFSDLISVTVSGTDEKTVLSGCIKLHETFRFYTKDLNNINILGPSPAGVTKVNNRYRYKLIISCENNRYIRDMISHSIKEFLSDKNFKGLYAYADSDPMD